MCTYSISRSTLNSILTFILSLAFSSPLHRAIDDVKDDVGGRDAVFVTAPEYFAVRLVQLSRRVEGQPLPRRWRALSFGPETVVVHRLDETTLRLDYEGGILTDPLLGLYRDGRLPMAPGERVVLDGLTVEVRSVTTDGRVDRADFRFDQNVDGDGFRFFYWKDGGFAPFEPPPVGGSSTLPRAELKWGLR
jgi:hypothetical protein